MIARTIIERAKAGERNVEVLCEAALNVPPGAVSAPNPPPLPGFTAEQAGFFILSQSGERPEPARDDTFEVTRLAYDPQYYWRLLTNRCQVEKLFLYG